MARPRKVIEAPYKVTLEVNAGEVHKSSGTTANEALSSLSIDYTQIKTKGTITLEHNGKKSSKFFYLPLLRRIMVNKLRKVQVSRDLEYLLK